MVTSINQRRADSWRRSYLRRARRAQSHVTADEPKREDSHSDFAKVIERYQQIQASRAFTKQGRDFDDDGRERGSPVRSNSGRSRTDRSVQDGLVEGKPIPGLFVFLLPFFFAIQSQNVILMKKE